MPRKARKRKRGAAAEEDDVADEGAAEDSAAEGDGAAEGEDAAANEGEGAAEDEGVDSAEEPENRTTGKRRKARAASSSTKPSMEAAEEPEFVVDEEDEDEEEEEEEEDEESEEEVVDCAEEEEEEGQGEEEVKSGPQKIWRPGIDTMEKGEKLEAEPGTYDMFHRAKVEWPCLSFDVLRDDLGAQRTTYPMTAYVVAGTQAAQSIDNRIYTMKWSKLYKTLKDGREDEAEDEESSGDSGDEHEALLELKGVPHPGGVNRIRSMPQASHIVATWADSSKVHMWSLQDQRKALDDKAVQAAVHAKPIHTCKDHKEEGFAMDFNPHITGHFLSGSNDGEIFLWEPVAGGWKVGNSEPFKGHTGAVEDVQWKRDTSTGRFIFASGSCDGSVRVWDVREKCRSKAAIVVAEAHDCDVNGVSWNPCVADLLMSGADDGSFKIWDTRMTAAGPMANFRWHRKPVTSVDWHPTDETVLAVASDDNSVSLWDMAVEDDAVGKEGPEGADHFPAQLLFLHQGQLEPKEARWHPQLPSVCITTACNGFNIFKTCNI